LDKYESPAGVQAEDVPAAGSHDTGSHDTGSYESGGRQRLH